MPSTAKDAFLEAIANSALNEDPGTRPGNAAGAEIPVTVHASRYSAAPKGGGKLPPIHEETRTVIIFPQGAVVRLSAAVTPGELVVLTNKRTGADVICRVTSVKTQPGIQNYVHLEFTQRALDFWENASTGSANATDKSVAVPGSPITKPPASPATTAIGSNYRVPSSPVPDVQTSTKTSAPAVVELKSVPSALPKITPLADAPADHVETAPANFQAPQSPVSEINAITPSVQKWPHVLPSRTPRFEPFERVISQDSSGSKTILVAIAAVVLLAIGAVAGARFLRDGANVVQPIFSARVATTSTTASAPSTPQVPIVNSSAKPSSPEVAASASAKVPPAEIPSHPPTMRASGEPPKSALAPTEPPKAEGQPQPALRPVINVGRISAPKMKTAAQPNSSAPPPVLPADASAMPSILGESVVNAPARSDPLASLGPAPPPVVKGGQLQQPKLLSSVAAVFPPLARAQHVQGDVVIDALIDATGKVAATKVITGNPLFQKAAVDSLLLWKYEPARLNGQAIPIHINVTISFHLAQ